LALAQVADSSRYGRVHIADDRQILGFEEKNSAREAGWINAGVYVLNREIIERIPVGRAVSLEREILPELVAAGAAFGFQGGRFIDIGTPESYAQAEVFFASH
jgi:NDP-sugar pyrophosphorylase family protein